MENQIINDPIVAIATARGNAGVGIIRISGESNKINYLIEKILEKNLPDSHKAYLRKIRDSDGSLIDEVLAICFRAPNSFTGETVLELQGHGGEMVLNWMIQRLLEVGHDIGLRLAKPGEFTERAFFNEKLDLAQAEAISDLISASSKSAIKAASRSMSGEFSQKLMKINDLLITLRIEIEATLDFPEEEIDFIQSFKAEHKLIEIKEKVENLLLKAQQGAILRNGITAVLVGSPNVGKSSLLNAVAGEEIAIVSEFAGTTRDKIQTLIHINGVPIHITDTAGIRNTKDVVEQIGIERTKQEISKADVVIYISDITQKTLEEDKKILSLVAEITKKNVPVLNVINKQDLATEKTLADSNAIYISAKTGFGLELLQKKLLEISGWQNSVESVYLARERQLESLRNAYKHLDFSQKFIQNNKNLQLEFFAEELRLASDYLGEVVGKTTSDDLLGKIFRGFCIGK